MTDERYYVYLLLRRPADELVPSEILPNVFYVGKGNGYRWESHFKAALTDPLPGTPVSAKSTEIRQILGDNPTSELIERHALIVAGHLNEPEAFRLEAIMLHLAGGVSATTNLVAGHAASELMVPAHDARVFFGGEDLVVSAWKVRGNGPLQTDLLRTTPEGSIFLMVKGTNQSFEEPRWHATKKLGRFPHSVVMESLGTYDEPRRGWDPHQPWTGEEAWSRVRRYWSAAPETISLWQQLIEARGGYVALLVPDPRDGRSVIRFIWRLDSDQPWEDYSSMKKFGFPRGHLQPDHPWLGKRPVDASRRGILHGRTNAPALTLWQPASS